MKRGGEGITIERIIKVKIGVFRRPRLKMINIGISFLRKGRGG